MKKTKTRAFTMVELVIVIAVLGVLAAVLIPVITGVISRANESSDRSLARNLSTTLRVSERNISDLNSIKETIDESYGEDFSKNLVPKTVQKGNHFWYNASTKMVELKTLEEVQASETFTKFDSSFRSSIKSGYVLLDTDGSDIALTASLIETVYSRMECDKILEYFAESSDIANNFVSGLDNTLIINENGCLRGSNVNAIENVYFTSDNVDLDKTTYFEVSNDKIDFKNISLDTPLAGLGLHNKTINIKKTMHFGTGTLIFADDAKVTLKVDVDFVEDLANIFAASSTNALIKINNDNNTYKILGDTIINSKYNIVEFKGLPATINLSVLNYHMPAVNETNVSQTVEVSDNKTVNEVEIATGESVSATIPSGVSVTGETLTLTVTAKEASEANIASGSFASQAIDVHIDGISEDNNVPVIIDLGSILPAELNRNNVELYHIEEYDANPMTRVESLDLLTEHNTFYYDFETGRVVIAIKSFSEILLRAGTVKKWDGTVDTSWYNTDDTDFTIDTAEKLAGLAQIVNGEHPTFEEDSFNGKTVRLGNDILINDWTLTTGTYAGEHTANGSTNGMSTNATNDPAFYGKTTLTDSEKFRTFTPIGKDYNHTFMGNFDGQGHKVSGLYGLWYDDPMHSDYLGLFGCLEGPTGARVKEGKDNFITIKDLTIDNSWFYYYGGEIGLVTSLSYGNINYEDINITGNYTSQYNWNSGGIIGYLYPNSNIIMKNVVVDDTNKFEALWETYDACVGGLIGSVGISSSYTPEITLTDCQVYPEMNVYNDVSSNYLWFSYRRSGMLFGRVSLESTNLTLAKEYLRDHVRCTNVLVHYGDWDDYVYVKWPAANNKPSYASEHEWKYRRYRERDLERDDSGNITNITYEVEIGDVVSARGSSFTITADDFTPKGESIPLKQLVGGGDYYSGFYNITLEDYEDVKTGCGVYEDTSIISYVVDGVTTRKLEVNGTNISLDTTLEKYGYKLYKWKSGSSLYDGTYTVNKNVTFTAIWKQRVALNPGCWDIDGAEYGICAYDETDKNDMWLQMEFDSSLNVYVAYVPVTHIYRIIFVRLDPTPDGDFDKLSWDNKWNESGSIRDVGSNLDYTFNIGDNFDNSGNRWVNRYTFLNANIWETGNARFAIYYFNSESDYKWRDMQYDSKTNRYSSEIINNYAKIIFVRMNGETTVNNWENEWNQTCDLEIKDNEGKTYCIDGWGKTERDGHWYWHS